MVKKNKVKVRVSLGMVLVFMFSLVLPVVPAQEQVAVAEGNDTQPIGDLKIGDKVVDNSWEWEHRTEGGYTHEDGDPDNSVTKPVTWIVVGKDHYGEGSGVTLLSEEIIARYTFDNSTDRSHEGGSDHWGDSGSTNADYGLRKFLNGSSYDYAGGYGGTYSGAPDAEGDGNTYAVTFYDAFSASFQDAVITTTVPCRANNNVDSPYNDEEYTTLDRVFLPSQVELNGATGYNHSAENVWPYFDSAVDADRIALESNGDSYWYWTRSPNVTDSHHVRSVGTDGSPVLMSAFVSFFGVRPALNLSSEISISGIPNEDGVYEIMENNDEPGNGEEGEEECYIATAVYGSTHAPEVVTLRSFRDDVLKESMPGRLFIKAYYALSPSVADYLAEAENLNNWVRNLLDGFVVLINSSSKE